MGQALKLLFIGVYGLAPFVPLTLLAFGPLPSTHTGRPFRDDLASALAMTGFALVFLEYLVIHRLRPIANLFGCGPVMRVHQLFARTACAFLVVHPFLYSLWGTMSPTGNPTPRTLGIHGASLLTGALAWASLMALVILAVHRHDSGKDHHRWRFWHAILAITMIGLGLHHTLHAGLYASLPWIAAYWWTLLAVAVLVNLTIYVVMPLHQRAHPYALTSVSQRAEQTWELILSPCSTPVITPRPGQFFWLKHRTPWSRRDHPFSVMQSSSQADELHFLIKEAGSFTRSIPHLPQGDRFYLDGPYGDFQILEHAQTVVLVAGGIGVAPVIHLLQNCAQRDDARRFLVIVAAQTPAKHVDLASCIPLSRIPHLSLVPVVDEPDAAWAGRVGRCDGAMVLSLCREAGMALDAPGVQVMICGPTAMADSVERELVSAGLPIAALTTERYQYDLGERSPLARRSVRQWWAISLAMLMTGLGLAYWI